MNQDRSLEDLCKPLSVKVGKPLRNLSGHEIRGNLHRAGDAAKLRRLLEVRAAKARKSEGDDEL